MHYGNGNKKYSTFCHRTCNQQCDCHFSTKRFQRDFQLLSNRMIHHERYHRLCLVYLFLEIVFIKNAVKYFFFFTQRHKLTDHIIFHTIQNSTDMFNIFPDTEFQKIILHYCHCWKLFIYQLGNFQML